MPEARDIDHLLFTAKRRNSDQPSMWDDYQFGADKAKYAEYFNDFHSFTAADFTITTTEAGAGSATEAIQDAGLGVLLLTNAAGDDDLDSLQLVGESATAVAGKRMWFECRFRTNEATQTDVLVGLVVTDTTPLAHVNGIVFRSDDGDANIDFATTSTTTSTENAIATLADDTFIKVGFKVSGTGLVEYFVNDVKQGELTSDIPTTEMRITFHIQNGETTAHNMGIDYVRLVQER